MRVGLVGCVKSKQHRPARAKDLYTSTLFSGRRQFVERTCDRWFVLSALHGLVDPDEEIEPYDVTLVDQDVAARAAWAAGVVDAIQHRLADLRGVTFEVHAGTAYRDFGLVDGLRALGARVDVPAEGLTFGEQLAFYNAGPAASAGGGYSANAALLSNKVSPVTIGFAELEAALGRPLPSSARRHRPWWGNTDQSPQGRAWLRSGWSVQALDLGEEHVTFSRGNPPTGRDEE